MVQISISENERNSGQLNSENVALAKEALRKDGIVVLKEVINLDHIAALREKMFADIDALTKRKDVPFNWNAGNLQQDPPPNPPYLFRDVLANDFAIQVSHSILGDGMFNAFYSGNTALPSESRQPVHADTGHLWQNQEFVHPAYGLVVNVPVVDMGPENGSTEVWPGTHQDPAVSIQDGFIEISEERLAHWRAISPPVQPVVNAGSIVIRDIRMWHAGMPNRTQTPRPMIAMIHYVSWWPTGKIKLHESAEDLLKHPMLRQHAEYTQEEVDHISNPGGHAYDASEV